MIINLIFSGLCSAQQDSSEEVNKCNNLLRSSNIEERINGANMIERSGLYDPKLFNIINIRLSNIDCSRWHDSEYIDELAWYCLALASSGRSEYKETLDTVARTANNETLVKKAQQSLVLIDQNALKINTSNTPSGQSPLVTRYVNMLRSGDDSAIKEVAHEMEDSPLAGPEIFEAANETLLKGYDKNMDDDDHEDAMAELCTLLGNSGNPAYKATLEQMINNTSNRKLKKYASKGLKMLN